MKQYLSEVKKHSHRGLGEANRELSEYNPEAKGNFEFFSTFPAQIIFE
jgi:hypothetical protein